MDKDEIDIGLAKAVTCVECFFRRVNQAQIHHLCVGLGDARFHLRYIGFQAPF
jgi:hypothetical protein